MQYEILDRNITNISLFDPSPIRHVYVVRSIQLGALKFCYILS